MLLVGTAFGAAAIVNELALARPARERLAVRADGPDARGPRPARAPLDVGATARLELQMDSSIDDRRPGQVRLDGIRNGADFRYAGFAASRVALGQLRHDPRLRSQAWRLGPGRPWRASTIDEAANHDLDRALVAEALTPADRAVAEDHGLSFIEGARARHCRITLDGDGAAAGAAAGARCSSARRTSSAGGASSTTGCSPTASWARSTAGSPAPPAASIPTRSTRASGSG